VKAGKEADEPVKMVAVQVADHDVFYPLKMDFESSQLKLGPLCTVY